jgi:phage shock protein A
MLTSNIEISSISHANLIKLAETVGEPVQDVLDQAIEDYRRQVFLRQLSQDFAKLRSDPELWQEELAERQAWDVTLMDGLDDE